jgi:putative inorganic carbon (hco3(-)) transporter
MSVTPRVPAGGARRRAAPPTEVAALEPAVSAAPDWAGPQLWSTLRFLCIPAALALLVLLGIPMPKWLLYTIGTVIGLAVAVRTFKDADWLVACVLLYLPLSREFAVPIAPGFNATNLLYIALLFAWRLEVRRAGPAAAKQLVNRKLVIAYALVTSASVVPAVLELGLDHFMDFLFEKYKSWIEQMLLFFILLGMIRDGATARRYAIYAMISTLVSVLFGAQEMIDKAGASTIEKSRVLGPQYQPNEFGGFIATNVCPFITLALLYFPKPRSFGLLSIVGIALKVLFATFSRGAVLGIGAASLTIGVLRGKKFLAGVTALAAAVILVFPQVLPESVADRFSETETRSDSGSGEKLDKSSADRLVLWQAGLQMIEESPLLGKGFGMFFYLKDRYTAVPVPVSDTHNMYLFIATQMGLPALFMFLAMCARMAACGVRVHRRHPDGFARAIGMACTAMVSGWTVVNMFGSRMQSIETCALFWAYMVIISHLDAELRESPTVEQPRPLRGRARALPARPGRVSHVD